ncbi:hypothetical protein FBU30_003581 [Linnemannia zychae]|nr:hypothetical protein FBU30_003581 [Linnemannia zychae]
MILLTIPAALLIYVSIYSMVQSTNKDGHGSAFKCGGRGRGGNVWCRLNWSSKFISAVLGFAVLYEIVLTLVWGPMEPRRNYLPRYSETANQQPIIHDGGKTGSTHGMIQYSQQPGLGEPAAAILGKNTLAPPEAGYPFPQQQVNLGDLNNTNNGNNTVNINANTQSLDIPPEVVYQYPAPQQYQYRSQHEQFKIPQPILTVIPTTSESTSQMAPR